MPCKKPLVLLVLFLAIILAVFFLLAPWPKEDGRPEAKQSISIDIGDLNAGAKAAEEPPLGPALRKAIESGNAEDCNSAGGYSGECSELFSFSEEHCSDSTDEKIFCIAFLKEEADYCGWIGLRWYSIACTALLTGEVSACYKAYGEENEALCVSEVARNLEGVNCLFEEADWREFCLAQRDLNSGKCAVIEDSSLKDLCWEIINREKELLETH